MRIETTRLLLRPWRASDRATWASYCADPEVRRFYWPAELTSVESDEMLAACDSELAANGFGFVAAELKATGAVVGGIGFSWTGDEVPHGPHIEIGWIFGRPYWGQGLAHEAAVACLDWGRTHLPVSSVVGYTSEINTASRRLMEKLGMRHQPESDFDDVTVPPGNPLRPHVLYRFEFTPAGRQ